VKQERVSQSFKLLSPGEQRTQRACLYILGTSSIIQLIFHWMIQRHVSSSDRAVVQAALSCFQIIVSVLLGRLIYLAWSRKRAFARAGLCPACGYDLRATPERCPERGRGVDERMRES